MKLNILISLFFCYLNGFSQEIVNKPPECCQYIITGDGGSLNNLCDPKPVYGLNSDGNFGILYYKASPVVLSYNPDNSDTPYEAVTDICDIQELFDEIPLSNPDGSRLQISQICIRGSFTLQNTIELDLGDAIFLEDGTSVNYTGTGSVFESHGVGNGISIKGTGGPDAATIITSNDEPIFSIRDFAGQNGGPPYGQSNHHTISGLNLKNRSSTLNPTNAAIDIWGNASTKCASQSCNVLSLDSGNGNQSSYYHRINNLTISDFPIGMRIRGHANGIQCNNIKVANASINAIYQSGTGDNVYSDITVTGQHQELNVIKMDTYVEGDVVYPCEILNDEICYLIRPVNHMFNNILVEQTVNSIIEIQGIGTANNCFDILENVTYTLPDGTIRKCSDLLEPLGVIVHYSLDETLYSKQKEVEGINIFPNDDRNQITEGDPPMLICQIGKSIKSNTLTQNRNIKEKDFKIFPNPSSQIINIESNVSTDNLNISLINSLGKTIINKGFDSIVNVSSLEDGMYFVIIYQESQILYYQKIIIVK